MGKILKKIRKQVMKSDSSFAVLLSAMRAKPMLNLLVAVLAVGF